MAPPRKKRKTKEELEKERLAKEAAAKKKGKSKGKGKGKTFVGKAFDKVNEGMKAVADKVAPSKTSRSEMDALAASRMPKPAPSPSPTSVRGGVRDFDYNQQPPNVQRAMEQRARAAQADPNQAYRQSQEGIMRRQRAEQNQLAADEAIRNDYDRTQANAGMDVMGLAASVPLGMGLGRAASGLAKTPLGQNMGHYLRGAYEGMHNLTGQAMRPATNMVGEVVQGLSTPIGSKATDPHLGTNIGGWIYRPLRGGPAPEVPQRVYVRNPGDPLARQPWEDDVGFTNAIQEELGIPVTAQDIAFELMNTKPHFPAVGERQPLRLPRPR